MAIFQNGGNAPPSHVTPQPVNNNVPDITDHATHQAVPGTEGQDTNDANRQQNRYSQQIFPPDTNSNTNEPIVSTDGVEIQMPAALSPPHEDNSQHTDVRTYYVYNN